MRRRFQGLSRTSAPAEDELPDGVFLVRVQAARYSWNVRKAYYLIRFSIQRPDEFASRSITGRIYCTRKALWKLSWFLRDFGYDTELFGHDEIDDKQLVGLDGVVKISHVVRNGITFQNLDAFAPAGQWDVLAPGGTSQPGNEVAS